MHPELKAYLDEFEAKAQARHEALLSKLITGASTPQPARPAVVASDGGHTVDATVVAVVPDAFCFTTQAQEIPTVAPATTPVCLDMVPVTCSTECPAQVIAIASVDKVHDATPTVYPEPPVDINDKEVKQLTPTRAPPTISTGISSLNKEAAPSVTTTVDIDPKAGVQEVDALFANTLFPAPSELDHGVILAVPSNLTTPALARCSTECPVPAGDGVKPLSALKYGAHHVAKSTKWRLLPGRSGIEQQPWPPPIPVQLAVTDAVLFHGIARGCVSGDPGYVWWPPDLQPRTKCELAEWLSPTQYATVVVHLSLCVKNPGTLSTELSSTNGLQLMQFNHMGSLFRPNPWPSFRPLSVTRYPDEPCSSIHSQSHGVSCFSPWLIQLAIRDVSREDPGNGTDAHSSGTDPAKTVFLHNASISHDEKEDASRTNGIMYAPSQVFPTELGPVCVSQEINALSTYVEEKEQIQDASAMEMNEVLHADNVEEDKLTDDTGSGEARIVQSTEKIHANDQPEDDSPISCEAGRSSWDLAFLKLFAVHALQIKFKLSKPCPWPSFHCFHEGAQLKYTRSQPKITHVRDHFSGALNSLKEYLRCRQSVQLKLPLSLFSSTCLAVQVWSELPNSELPGDYYSIVTIFCSPDPISVDDLGASENVEPPCLIIHEQVREFASNFRLEKLWGARDSVYKIQEQGNFCEHYVLEHSTICSTRRPGNLQEAMLIMSMSVEWSFLRLEEFQGSGCFTRACISELCSVPCARLACLMVQPIGSVRKRGVQTNDVKSKEFKGSICLCSSINLVSLASSILITLEQFTDKNSYELPRVEFQSSTPDFNDAHLMRESSLCLQSAQQKPCRSSIRYMGHPFRPKPWPIFNYHSDVCCAAEPCSAAEPCFGIHSQPHEVSWFSYGLVVSRFRDVASLPVYCCDLVPMEEPLSCFQQEGLSNASGMADVESIDFPIYLDNLPHPFSNVNHHESLCTNATVTNLKLQFTDCPAESMHFSLLAHKEDGQQHVSKLFQLVGDGISDVEVVPRSIFTLHGCHSADFCNTTSAPPPYKRMQQENGVSSYDSPGCSYIWCEGLWTSEIARKNSSKGLLLTARQNQSVDMRKCGTGTTKLGMPWDPGGLTFTDMHNFKTCVLLLGLLIEPHICSNCILQMQDASFQEPVANHHRLEGKPIVRRRGCQRPEILAHQQMGRAGRVATPREGRLQVPSQDPVNDYPGLDQAKATAASSFPLPSPTSCTSSSSFPSLVSELELL